MPQIQDPALAERLRRHFAIVGPSTIDTISPELVGVVVVDTLLPRQDLQEAVGTNSITGDAADISESGLQNLDATRLLVIDQLIVDPHGVALVRVRLGDPGGTPVAGANTFHTDFRNQFNAPALMLAATDLNTAAGSGNILFQARHLANSPFIWRPNFVLRPAGTIVGGTPVDRIHWDQNIVAQTLTSTVFFHFEEPGLRNV